MGKKALQFHRITPDFQLCGTWNTPAQFTRMLHFLQQQAIPVVLPDDPGDGIIITFDDGEQNVYDHAFPLLKKYNMKALIFLVVGYINEENKWDINPVGQRVRHLTWDQIHEMEEWGIEFGSHTLTHRNLTHLSRGSMHEELVVSKQILEDKIGYCRSVSYPFNRVNDEVLAATRSAGYDYGFGGPGKNNLLIKKEALYITDTIQNLQTKVYENPPVLYWYERMKQKTINMFTVLTMLLQKNN